MKLERTQNAKRNIATGLPLKLYRTLMPFIMRTALIYLLGAQYLGLSSLFTSILEVLNLAELGVGSAMVYSMYKPIVEDDDATICALMNLYKKYYRIIGLMVLAAGLVLLPFVPSLIHGDVPQDINVRVLYLMYLGTTVLSYWLFAYKNSLLQLVFAAWASTPSSTHCSLGSCSSSTTITTTCWSCWLSRFW